MIRWKLLTDSSFSQTNLKSTEWQSHNPIWKAKADWLNTKLPLSLFLWKKDPDNLNKDKRKHFNQAPEGRPEWRPTWIATFKGDECHAPNLSKAPFLKKATSMLPVHALKSIEYYTVSYPAERIHVHSQEERGNDMQSLLQH